MKLLCVILLALVGCTSPQTIDQTYTFQLTLHVQDRETFNRSIEREFPGTPTAVAKNLQGVASWLYPGTIYCLPYERAPNGEWMPADSVLGHEAKHAIWGLTHGWR